MKCEAGSAPIVTEDARQGLHRSSSKLILLALGIGLCLIVVYATPLKSYLHDVDRIRSHLNEAGVYAPLLFCFGTAGLVAIGFPRLAFSFLGGLLFGFAEGFALSLAGTLLGAYATFLAGRFGMGRWVEDISKERSSVKVLLREPTLGGVFLLRLLPVHGFWVSLVLGATPVGHGAYLIGSFLGFLPEAAATALIGSGVGSADQVAAFFKILSAAAVGLLGVGLLWRLAEAFGKRAKLTGEEQECRLER